MKLDFDVGKTADVDCGTCQDEGDHPMVGHVVFKGVGKTECQDRAKVVVDLLGSSARTRDKVCDAVGTPANACLFGIFDGHGGCYCSEFLQRNLVKQFWLSASEAVDAGLGDDPERFFSIVMAEASAHLEAAFIKSFNMVGRRDGSTGNMVLLWDDLAICANVGDSRAAIGFEDGTVFHLSEDHKPDRPDERERVEAAGSSISLDPKCNEYRLDRKGGKLSMTRTFGDSPIKRDFNTSKDKSRHVLIATAEITTRVLTEEAEFLFLASDGIWCRIEWEESSIIVADQLQKGSCSTAAHMLIKRAKELQTNDDCSVIVVDLKKYWNTLR